MTKPTNEQTHSINALMLNLNDSNFSLIEKAKLCRETLRQNDPIIVQALNNQLKDPKFEALKKLLIFVHKLDEKDERTLAKARSAYGSDAPDTALTASDRLRHQLIESEAQALLDIIKRLVSNEKNNDPNSYTKLRACFVASGNNVEVLGKLQQVAKEQSGFSPTQSKESAAIYKAILNFKIGNPEAQKQSLATLENAVRTSESPSTSPRRS